MKTKYRNSRDTSFSMRILISHPARKDESVQPRHRISPLYDDEFTHRIRDLFQHYARARAQLERESKIFSHTRVCHTSGRGAGGVCDTSTRTRRCRPADTHTYARRCRGPAALSASNAAYRTCGVASFIRARTSELTRGEGREGRRLKRSEPR